MEDERFGLRATEPALICPALTATTRSATSTSSSPPASASPCTPAMTGIRNASSCGVAGPALRAYDVRTAGAAGAASSVARSSSMRRTAPIDVSPASAGGGTETSV